MPAHSLAPWSRRTSGLRSAEPRGGRLRARAAALPTSSERDPLAVLERQAKTRVPALVPIRYGRILVAPFAFFRDAASVMASDLATTPRSGLTAQLCGDAHLANFGMFASPDRRLVFDINDFDETLPGPWEWDLKRLLASLAVAARENGDTAPERRRALLAAAREYRESMRRFAAMSSGCAVSRRRRLWRR